MKTAIAIGAPDSGKDENFESVVDFVVECEKLGVDTVWSAEAWGMDALTPLAYVAARTKTIRLGTGIAQVSARTPSNLAMSALSLALLSGNRFLLGLGVSGPQVVEGLHGTSFAKPLARMRELVGVLKLAFAGEKLRSDGEHVVLPRPGGEGKALRLAFPPNPNVPIFLATLGPKALEFTGEAAVGWLGTSFTPAAASVYLDPIRRGAERAGRSLDDLTLAVGTVVGIGDDVERMVAKRKPPLAFQLGAMGSPKTNFYHRAFCRIGYEDAALEVQRLWLEGKREEAVARVPDEMALETSVLGTEAMVRERLRAYEDAGIDLLQLQPMGRSRDQKLETIATVNRILASA